MANNVVLSPIAELAPGQVAAIRNQVIKATVAQASKELSLPPNKLVVRDIRPYSDLGFGNNTDYMADATVSNVWGTYEVAGTYVQEGGAGSYKDAVPDNTTMADQRYVAIYGVRDLRTGRPKGATTDKCVSVIKFDIGNAWRALWDCTKFEVYDNMPVGISSSAIVIPPLAAYQISPYVSINTMEPSIQLMGVVVEPAGLLISPVTRTDEMNDAIQTHLIPVAELGPGEISHIRNQAKEATIKQAMAELNLPREKLVVRDIRPYSDLAIHTHATSGAGSGLLWNAAVTSTDTWINTFDATNCYVADATTFYNDVAVASTQMADARFVCIYGVRDHRMSLATTLDTAVSMLKITTGGNDRVIWDIQGKDAYPDAQAAVCPSPVIIPQNTEFQFGLHSAYTEDNAGTDLGMSLSFMGFVVEPVGKVLSP